MTDAAVKSIYDHLEELRGRIFVSIIFLLLASVFSYPLASSLLARIKTDLLSGQQLVIIAPLEAVSVNVKISILLGFLFSLPLLAYELWAFVRPALTRRESSMIAGALLPSAFLFLLGAVFAYKVLLPVTLSFMLNEAYPAATPMLSLNETVSFILFIVATTGLSFQLPLVVYALAKAGVVDRQTLSSKRKHVIVVIFIFAALITPDPTFVSQILVALPMVLLYEAGVLIARITS
ncbi:MAG: twin-arginine translocase subunit TatC [Candidatus Altiarchaeota archaeon]|nr:twin-arginine translocase subunit TatC [Candidatus Altiarchaeota archaeon]